ncbi:hypothetical protein K439DRAFT_1612845 [Ramaria rubella]|nr:hypothetical protein K439DRAFT_1612845 [Ramaria rubella]
MCIVIQPIKKAGEVAVPMADSKGNVHMHRTFLGAWISDKEEQDMIACLGANSCTTCLAETKDLDKSQPCGLQTGKSILDKIQGIQRQLWKHASTWEFVEEAKKSQLNGVEHPFWEDLPHTDICKVICHDVLDGLHKAFTDHTAKWNIAKVTEFEMDHHFRHMPKTNGYRHFPAGISKLSQWSGHEWKDLQRLFLPTLYGRQRKGVIRVTCAELYFIYHAQWKALAESDLHCMDHFNQVYHENKNE